MQHPFAGIILTEESNSPSQSIDELPNQSVPARRSLLKGMLLFLPAMTGLSAFSGRLRGADRPEAIEAGDLKKLLSHQLYLVEPKNANQFNDRQRKSVGVLGPMMKDFEGDLKGKSGWLAWLTPTETAKLAEAENIDSVTIIKPTDKPSPRGNMDPRSRSLIVMLAPNMWRNKPVEETYESSEQVAKDLSAEFKNQVAEVKAVTAMFVTVKLKNAKRSPDIVPALKKHAQVISFEWDRVATTLRVGEEGGGAWTTTALGEEGNPPRPSTRRLGEEGGRPPVSTKAVGEEGGRPPAVTTNALGEEGGPKVPPRVTTFAVGEE